MTLEALRELFKGVKAPEECIYEGSCRTCPLNRDYDPNNKCMLPDLKEIIEAVQNDELEEWRDIDV